MKTLAERIRESINQIWSDYYTEQGIVTGDIAPLELLEYERHIEEIAELIHQVGESNREV